MNGDAKGVAQEESGAVVTDEGAIVIGRKVCPPKEKVFWRFVDSGVQLAADVAQAAKDAEAAYLRAYPGQVQKAEADAQNFVRVTKCGQGCAPNGTMVLGIFSSTQEWEFNIHDRPNTARTSSYVGYVGIVFCK